MRRFATLATTAVAALALAVPTASVAQAAPGLPGAAAAQSTASASGLPGRPELFKPKKGKGGKVKIKKSSKGVQPGVSVLKLTVKAKGKGKVKFTVTGPAVKVKGKAKIKNGKAKYTVPALNTGDYKVKAKIGKLKGKTKFRVYASALSFTTPTSFTISKKQDDATLPQLAGNVSFKDTIPNQGYIDIYPLGSPLGAANTVRFVGVGAQAEPDQPAGAFNFASSSTSNTFLQALQSTTSYPPGTYQFQAYYTFDSDFVDYLTSSVITVVINP